MSDQNVCAALAASAERNTTLADGVVLHARAAYRLLDSADAAAFVGDTPVAAVHVVAVAVVEPAEPSSGGSLAAACTAE